MDRSALLAALAAAGAALAFAVGATAFAPTLDSSDGAIDGPSGAKDPPERAAAGSAAVAADSGADSSASSDDCVVCSDLDVRSVVADAFPAVDPRLLLAGLAAAVVALVRAGLRSSGDDAAIDADSNASNQSVGTRGDAPTTVQWSPDAPPRNDVDRAWLSMVDRIDVSNPAVTTPRDYVREAADADLPHDAVRRLTSVFEVTRYGQRDATRRHERVAREAASRIGTTDDPSESGDR